MNSETKAWWQSKTILAVLAMILTPILAHFGLSATDAESEALARAIITIITTASGVIAVYGRVTARARIG